jgi:hypothetical protein
MGQVINFSNHQGSARCLNSSGQDSLIPVELALGIDDETACLTAIAKYGNCPVHPRLLSDGSGAVIYLMLVSDAIWLNKRMLELETLDDEKVSSCIDLIQMLENVNDSLLESAWGSIGNTRNQFS